MRVLFITIGDRTTASTRTRVLQILPTLEKNGIAVDVLRFPGHSGIYRFVVRAVALAIRSDVVFIQKRIPPVILTKALRFSRAKLIFDLDDAIFEAKPFSPVTPEHLALRRRRLDSLLKTVECVIAGNEVLAAYARQHNSDVVIVPTVPGVLERLQAHPPAHGQSCRDYVTLGWIGNAENLYYLTGIAPALQEIGRRYPGRVRVEVVSDGAFAYPGMTVTNKRWDLDRELEDLLGFDIGLMPLGQDRWSAGKCGFKALQYMSVGVPVVASPVGVNKVLVGHGRTGLTALTDAEWVAALTRLIEDRDLRRFLGENGKQLVRDQYAVASYAAKVQMVLERVGAKKRKKKESLRCDDRIDR